MVIVVVDCSVLKFVQPVIEARFSQPIATVVDILFSRDHLSESRFAIKNLSKVEIRAINWCQ